MKHVNQWMAGALALIVFASVSFKPAEGARIAVVDMAKLVSQAKQSQAEQSLLQQWKDASEKLLEKMDKDLKAEKGTLDQFKPGSDDWKKKQQELKLGEFKLSQQAKALDEEFESRVARFLIDAHSRASVACKSYLDTHDVDAVLQYASAPVSGNTQREVMPEIVLRTVVAYRGTLDATDGVLAILDAGK